MKKIYLLLLLLISLNIYTQTITFEPDNFQSLEENLSVSKEHLLFKRDYNHSIDGDYRIDKIVMIPRSTKATIHFFGHSISARYYMYPDPEQTIYLFKINKLGNFSVTLTRDSGKIRYLYMIPNRGLFDKEPLRDMPEEDIEFLKGKNFSDSEIELINKNNKYTIFYTGFATFK